MSIDLLIIKGKDYMINLFCEDDVVLCVFADDYIFTIMDPLRLGRMVSNDDDTFPRPERFAGGMRVGIYDPKHETEVLEAHPEYMMYVGEIVEVMPGDELYKRFKKKPN